jgi:hypothetical protein
MHIIDNLEYIDLGVLPAHIFVSFGLNQSQIDEGLKEFGSTSKFKIGKGGGNLTLSKGDEFLIHFEVADPKEEEDGNKFILKEISLTSTEVAFQLLRNIDVAIDANTENIFKHLQAEIFFRVSEMWFERELKLDLMMPSVLKPYSNPILGKEDKKISSSKQRSPELTEKDIYKLGGDPEKMKKLISIIDWINCK